MGSDTRQSGGRFIVKQAALLLLTIFLLAFCTIPLMQAIKWLLNPAELKADVQSANEALADIRTKLAVADSKKMMGAGDEETQEKLKKQVEELKQQMALKELENKYLENQIVLAQTLAELAKMKSANASAPVVDTGQKGDKPVDSVNRINELVGTGQKILELFIKLFGSIGSLFTGCMFVVSWWRKRRQPTEQTAA